MAAASADTTSSGMSKPLDHRRLSTATTVASRLSSSSSLGSDVVEGLWMLPSPTTGDDDIDIDMDDVLGIPDDTYEHATRSTQSLDRDISIALVHALKQENALLRHDLDKLQDAHDLARHLRQQVEKLEMELLIRGSDSRARLTSDLSSHKLRASLRSDRMSPFESARNEAGCVDGSGDDATSRYDDIKDSSPSYEDDMEQPEIERECDAYLRESFFAEEAIDAINSFTLSDNDREASAAAADEPAPVSCASACVDCDALARELAHAHAVIAALLAAELQPQSAAGGRNTHRCGDLEQQSEDNVQDHTHHRDVDHVAMQNRESAAQQRIDELEAELAHVRALSSCQKALLDAFQHDLADEGERLLHTESGGGFRDDRRSCETQQQQSSRLLRRLQHEHLGGSEVKTLLVALALVCATLYSVSSVLESVVN